nr:zinc knuckle CX2CX4HX4C [Tanacetum cinerariifolium]
MLDSYTSSMCKDSWGRSSFTRCLIEVNSEADLVDIVTIGIPSLTGDDFTKETIRVKYEWRPPRCDEFNIFGHVHDHCPKKMVSPPILTTSNVVTIADTSPTNDNFTTSNSFSALNDEDEDNEEVENVYDESANLVPNKNISGSSSFMAAAG